MGYHPMTEGLLGGFVTADILQLPAGPLAFGIGFEERLDRYEFRPDTADQGGEFTSDPLPPITGEIDLTEFFAEARVPILEGAPLAETLALELAIRQSDYSTIGSVSTWKAGVEWAPVDWVRLRTAFNQAIRSPNLDELFATVAIGFSAGDDPCDQDLSPSAAQQQLCVAQGVDPADIATFDQINVGFGVRSGGNPDLQEEKADTFTIGAVVSPPFVRDLNVTIDYYDIQIDNAINQLSAQQVVNNCFRADNLNPDSDTCRAINRFSSGQIDFVDARSLNVAEVNATGLDLQIDWGTELGDGLGLLGPAELNLRFIASWAFDNETIAEPGQPGLDCLGFFGSSCSGFNVFMQPDRKYVLNANYDTGNLHTRLQWRNIPGLDLFPGAGNVVKSIDAVNYLDLNVDYTIADRYTLFFGVDNMLDDEPPVVGFSLAGDANVDISLYDTLGRRFFGGLRLRL